MEEGRNNQTGWRGSFILFETPILRLKLLDFERGVLNTNELQGNSNHLSYCGMRNNYKVLRLKFFMKLVR